MGTVTTERWRSRGQLVDCGRWRLFCVDTAQTDCTPVLLLHGFPTSSWDWQLIWPALAARYRIVAPDLLGFGFSDKPTGHRYTIHEQADLIEALTERLRLPHFHVLAHDYGDTVAQELLARDNARGQDGRWLSVSLLNGGLFPETHHARPAQKLLLGPLGGLFVRLMGKATLAKNMRNIFGKGTPPEPAHIDAFWELITYNNGQRNFHRLIRYMSDRLEHRERWLAALQEARVPVQLINGSDDPVSGAHMVARYRELVRSDNIVALPGIGHYPQIEAPDAVATNYLSFLDTMAI